MLSDTPPTATPPAAPAGKPPWAEVRRWFEAALALPAAERGALLAQQAVSEAVRQEVLSLLAHHEDQTAPSGFLSSPAERPAGWPPLGEAAAASASDGQRIGPWEVVGQIGQGGMGEVFEARRADGSFEGRAAIKLLKRGMDSAAVLQRFALERQALARLNHPHIARLLDAGLAQPAGLPYFVMELVDGQPIDQAAQGRPLAQRLQLFLQLADAVSHAHRNLLVHRDLKPSNVLVDKDKQVKLLDFGIAKALDPLDGLDANATIGLQRPFTPNYASPEQVRGEPVGTATDTYSLGVLLYQMLTSVRPTGRHATTAAEAARSVLAEKPTRPSSLAAEVVGDPQWLLQRKHLKGDLDNILLKALEKTVERRYPTVDAMAQDVRRFLSGHPISARPAGAAYLLGKFIRRNPMAVGSAALALLFLVGGLGAVAWQAHQTDLARRTAEHRFAQVRQLTKRMVFNYHDQIVNLPGALKVREALLQDAVQYLDELQQGLGADRQLAREVAETYHRIAILQGETFSPSQEKITLAEASVDKALALLPRYIERPEVDTATLNAATDMWMTKAALRSRRGQLNGSVAALEQAQRLSERARALAPDNLEVISRQATVAGRLAIDLGGTTTQATLGRVAEAGEHWHRAVALFDSLRQREPGKAEWLHQAAWGYGGLTSWAMMNRRADEAEAFARTMLALRDQALAARPNDGQLRHQTAVARLNLAGALAMSGRFNEALALQQEGERIVRKSTANDPNNKVAQRDLALIGLSQARTLLQAGQPRAARPLLAKTLRDLPPADTLADDFYLGRWRAETLVWSARAWLDSDPAQARRFAQAAVAMVQSLRTDPSNAAWHWTLALALGEDAAAAAALGQTDEAARLAQQALDRWAKARPGEQPPAFFSPWVTRDRGLAGPG